jgi:hypothetical protein
VSKAATEPARGSLGQKHTPMCLLLDSPARKRGWPFICTCRRDQPKPTEKTVTAVTAAISTKAQNLTILHNGDWSGQAVVVFRTDGGMLDDPDTRRWEVHCTALTFPDDKWEQIAEPRDSAGQPVPSWVVAQAVATAVTARLQLRIMALAEDLSPSTRETP